LEVIRLAAMVPHRDTGRLVRLYCRSNFPQGNVPQAIPLARLSRALSGEELRSLARALGKVPQGAVPQEEGRFRLGAITEAALPGTGFLVRGLLLEPGLGTLPLPPEALIGLVIPPVLCTELYPGSFPGEERPEEIPAPEIPPFRVAAAANLIIRIKETRGAVFTAWKTGPLAWISSNTA
jgi:hypothetical protein